ncbi:MAG: quinol:electron acceptor oxidoreductase subunit ActD, partial [Phycisphaerae bacterium]
ILPKLIFCGGLTGCLLGLFLTCYTNGVELLGENALPLPFAQFTGYQIEISGKPYFSIPAFIPVIFELTILFSALTAVFGMLALNNLPLLAKPLMSNERFRLVTNDRFFVYVDASDPRFHETQTVEQLRQLGGSEPIRVNERTGPVTPPKWMLAAGVIAACFLLIPLVVITKARNSKSREPRIHIFQDMDNQEKYKGQMANPVFADGRAMRAEAPGTVARGDIRATGTDLHFTEGLVDGAFATTFPKRVPITEETLERGQARFAIYCAPCHGLDGLGAGPVAARNVEGRDGWATWVAPTSLHDQSVRDRAHGHLFNTITNGIRSMPPYGAAIPIEDRWAIVSYVRALQRSTAATMNDVPADIRTELEAR